MAPNFVDSIPQGTGTCGCGAKVEPIKFAGRTYTPTACLECLEKANRDAEEQSFKEGTEEQGIRSRFRNCTFDTYVANGNRRALDLCRIYADAFPPSDGSGLCLHGGWGTGKTHLGIAVARAIPGSFVINCAELLDDIRNSFDGAPSYTFTNCRKAPLLVLDDVGQEKGTAWVWERLYILINTRYENMLPTIFTTNLKPSEWAAKWGGAVDSRIRGMSTIIELKGVDYRTLKK